MSFTSTLGNIVQAPFNIAAKPIGWVLKPVKKPLGKVLTPVFNALRNPKVQATMGLGYTGWGLSTLASAIATGNPLLGLFGLLRLKGGGTTLAHAFDPRISKKEHEAVVKALAEKSEARRKLALKLGLGAGGVGGLGAGYLLAKRNNDDEEDDEPRRIYRRTH